jgi:hypothetical protein
MLFENYSNTEGGIFSSFSNALKKRKPPSRNSEKRAIPKTNILSN